MTFNAYECVFSDTLYRILHGKFSQVTSKKQNKQRFVRKSKINSCLKVEQKIVIIIETIHSSCHWLSQYWIACLLE